MNLKPQPVINKRDNLIIGLFVFIFTITIYYLTMARSLSFWDAGEYITCSSILGVPHPPGNPFYILIGRFFTILGMHIPHAIVINFLSGLFSALAVMFTYFFTVKLVTMWIQEKSAYIAYIAGFIAAMYSAFSFTYWNNAIEAEVYSGLAFIITLIVWLTLIWVERSKGLSHQNILLLIIYIFFLGFGIHQTSLQIAPAVLFIAVYPMLRDLIKTSSFWKRVIMYTVGLIFIYLIFLYFGKLLLIPALPKFMFALAFLGLLIYHLRNGVSTRTWLLALLFVVVALSTHLFLFIRSSHRPFINEGYPHTFDLFSNYILRRQYGVTSMFVRRASFFFQMKEQFLKYFSWQFFNAETISRWLHTPQMLIQLISNLLVTLLGFGGAYYHIKKNKHSFAYFFSFIFMASIAMVFVINLSDAEVRERDYFFTTAYSFWTVWMAIGSIALIDLARKKSKFLAGLLIVIVLLLPVLNLSSQYFIHNRSREYIALDYGQNILNSVEENAIIFTNGDNDTFPVWYAQAVHDPAAKEYIQPSNPYSRDEEGKISKQVTMPTEKTHEMISKAMAFKNEQCKGIRKDISIANLSLLNTPWYIKQLRDNEGIEFNIPDKHIDVCQDNPRSALYPRKIFKDTNLTITGTYPGDEFVVTIKKDAILYTKDLAVIQIIRDNYGKRPIYFAVTTPDPIGFTENLRNEGMVSKLVPTKGKDQFDLERLMTNIDSVYSYRGIMDDTIYKDKNMRRLLNNYGAAFMRTSRFAHRKNDYDNAIKYMEKAIDFIDQKSRFYIGLSQLYAEAAFNSFDMEETEKGFDHLEKAVYYNRSDKNMIQLIYQSALYTNEIERALDLFNKIRAYQDTSEINFYISNLKEQLKDD
ncbi:MAG: DUF2723 domain-containing protein [Candidatus Cloacimonetes bacterium]|nr:DUF2723 domain-containing protein [Candidatus Cloacimonadota bacterium]